jgi:hypothetical protein
VVSLTIALVSSVTLDNFRVFVNGALRAIFGGEGVAYDCRKSQHAKLHNVFSSPVDKIGKNMMDRACSTFRRDEKRIQGFVQGRGNLENLHLHGKIKLKQILKNGFG